MWLKIDVLLFAMNIAHYCRPYMDGSWPVFYITDLTTSSIVCIKQKSRIDRHVGPSLWVELKVLLLDDRLLIYPPFFLWAGSPDIADNSTRLQQVQLQNSLAWMEVKRIKTLSGRVLHYSHRKVPPWNWIN